MVVLAPHGEVVKTLPMLRVATHTLNVSVDAVVGVEPLATTLAGKYIVTVLPNFELAKQMNTPIHVLLKADPCLVEDVAEDKADPLVYLQLNQIYVLRYLHVL